MRWKPDPVADRFSSKIPTAIRSNSSSRPSASVRSSSHKPCGRPYSYSSRTFASWHRVRGVVSHRLAQQRLERGLVDRVSLAKVDRPPRIAAPARVEQLLGIGELGSMEERELHLVLVGVGEGVHPLVRPDWTPHPLPFL